MKDTETLMQTRFQDHVPSPGSLTIRFLDPAHLADSMDYASKKGLHFRMMEALSEVMMLFRYDASGVPPTREVKAPMRGVAVTLTFTPDSRVRPSFRFRGEVLQDVPGEPPRHLMSGGLIFHENTWRIET